MSTFAALVKSILFKRPDDAAPVSPLYLFGRKHDVACERERGRSAGKRDQLRLWRSDARYPGDRFDTDGELMVIVLTRCTEHVSSPRFLQNPPRVAAKNRAWYAVHRDREVPGHETSGDVQARRNQAESHDA